MCCYICFSRCTKVNHSISCCSFFVRRCDFCARESVFRHGPINSFCTHHETHWDLSYPRAWHEKMRTSKRITQSLREFLRQDDIHKSRCPQWTVSLGTAFFSYFYFAMKRAFCESQAVFFSHSEAHLQAYWWLFFIRDSQKNITGQLKLVVSEVFQKALFPKHSEMLGKCSWQCVLWNSKHNVFPDNMFI